MSTASDPVFPRLRASECSLRCKFRKFILFVKKKIESSFFFYPGDWAKCRDARFVRPVITRWLSVGCANRAYLRRGYVFMCFCARLFEGGEEALGVEGCFATAAGCGDGLAIVGVGNVACGKNAFNVCGGRLAFGDNVALLIEVDNTLKQ